MSRSDAMARAALLALVLGLAGCNTVEGVGLDIAGGARTVGDWVTGSGY
ncbi:entericidin [Rhodobacteraceae bacterium WD3A24]|nr:entericidin [Rhodobacteraceae bacterium WD3A24]